MLTHHSCRPGGISATRREGYSVRVLCRGDKKKTKHLPCEHMRTFMFPCFCANKPFVLMNLCCKHGNKVSDIIDRREHLFLRFAISQRYVFLSCWTVPRSPVGVKAAGWLNVSSKRSTGVCPRVQLSPLERIAGVWSPRKRPIFHQHPFKTNTEHHRHQYRPQKMGLNEMWRDGMKNPAIWVRNRSFYFCVRLKK